MKKETTIDLAKFEEALATIPDAQKTEAQKREARKTIDCIQNQFLEIVVGKIEANPVFDCRECATNVGPIEHYYSDLMVCGIQAWLNFSVKVTPDLSISLLDVDVNCDSLSLYSLPIRLRKGLKLRLDVSDESKSMFLQYEASVGN